MFRYFNNAPDTWRLQLCGPHRTHPFRLPFAPPAENYSLMSMPKRRFSLPLCLFASLSPFPPAPAPPQCCTHHTPWAVCCCLELGSCCSCFSAPAFAAWHAYENWPIWRSVWLHFVVVVPAAVVATCVCVCVCPTTPIQRHTPHVALFIIMHRGKLSY